MISDKHIFLNNIFKHMCSPPWPTYATDQNNFTILLESHPRIIPCSFINLDIGILVKSRLMMFLISWI